MSPCQASFIHLGTSAFIGFVPVQIPDQPPLIVWVECILPLTVVMELDHERLVVSIISVSFWQSWSVRWVHASCLIPKFLDSVFYFWLHISPEIVAWATASFITWRGGSLRRTSIATAGGIFIIHVIALEANICNWTEFSPADLVRICNPEPPNCGAIGPHGSDQYGCIHVIPSPEWVQHIWHW